MRLLWLTILSVACVPDDAWRPRAQDPARQASAGEVDEDDDGDGYCENGRRDDDGDGTCDAAETVALPDCDDTPGGGASVHPGAVEVPANGVDEDCDTFELCYVDGDGDGHGSSATVVGGDLSCSGPGESVLADDCADFEAWNSPSGVEICDSRDNDCDGEVDEGAAAPSTWYADADGDGFGDPGSVATACSQPPGFVGNPDDCDDHPVTGPGVHPGEAEVLADGIDQDCDGADACFADGDGDGFGHGPQVVGPLGCPGPDFSGLDTDCDDTQSFVWPGAVEVCDGLDDDCDGTADDGLVFVDYAPDVDGDGFGDPGGPSRSTCGGAPTGHVEDATDCDDDPTTGSHVFPGAPEIVANGVDEDCDTVDACFEDLDGDGAGTATVVLGNDLTCAGSGESTTADDCDDADPLEFPGQLWFVDCDGDGVVVDSPVTACDEGEADAAAACGTRLGLFEHLAPLAGDCDDADPLESPGQVWFADCDGDGAFAMEPVLACAEEEADGTSPCLDTLPPDSWLHALPGEADCDDELALRSPLRDEVCEPFGQNQIDNDCDGDVNGIGPDGGAPTNALVFHVDFDLDGFGAPGAIVMACEATAGLVPNDADCDDVDPSIHVGADEVCDGRDQNCNQLVDEADFLAAEDSFCIELYRDRDGDGFGDQGATACLCVDLDGGDLSVEYDNELYVATFSDCDDLHADLRPHGCNDGRDNDGDGFVDAADSDCDPVLVDGIARQPLGEGPGDDYLVEVLDGHDNDCDGFVPFIELDCDDDGSLAALPIEPTGPIRNAADVGLADCAGPPIQVSCWDETLTLECDALTGLWVTRWGASEDGFGGRYSRAYRNQVASVCERRGDCDDLCPSRCPGAEEACDGLDNDCSGGEQTPDTDGIPASLQGNLVLGTMSSAEVDLDGDGFAACLDDFRSDDVQDAVSTAGCLPTVDEERASDCDDGCYLANALSTEQCNGFRDVCGVSTPAEGLDLDGDGHRTCGVGGAVESELTEQFFAAIWVSCATDREGCGPVQVAPPAEVPAWVPLLLPRPLAPACDAPLRDALTPLAERVGVQLDQLEPAQLVALCDPATGGFCTTVALVNDPLVEDAEWVELARLEGTIDEACLAAPEQYHGRSVWPASRIVGARETVVQVECLRIHGARCEDLPVGSVAREIGAPPGIDDLLEGDAPWWQSIGRYQPDSTQGALLTCWGDPLSGRFEIGDEVGGDCADERSDANRDRPEGPTDLLGVYLGDPGDCGRCVDGVDNNCDGRTDCEDPSCEVCFIGESRGCRGTRNPCNLGEEGGGCQSSGQGGSVAIGLVGLLLGVRLRRRPLP